MSRFLNILLVICSIFFLLPDSGLALAPADQAVSIQINGLTEPVEVLRDRWGINHIFAKNEHDLFFAQGYCAARDRLFQFELWRRQATGTMAEILGRKELNRDIGARLHMFRGNLKAELNWYHPHGNAIVTAFVEGVNAYIDEAVAKPEDLPIEFKILGIKPGRWTTADVISRHNGLFGNVWLELDTAMAIRSLGVEKVKALSQFYGGEPSLTIDPSIDLALLTPKILGLYSAFRAPVRFTAQDIDPQYRSRVVTEEEVLEASSAHVHRELGPQPEESGSNNWVVSGKMTSTGKPLLANDPHRTQGVPSLRYWAHLVAPGWNVIGAGEPTLPGISIGHNSSGAWGLTIFGTQNEDLYIYNTNPANPSQYKYKGHWEDMKIIKDSIQVKGEAPVAVELKYVRNGPVLYEDKEHHKAYVIRAAWLDIGGAPYLASLRMDQASKWSEFREACSYSRVPAENMVWADTQGNIGYQAVAVAPIRHNWSGLVPIPGDGRYEWDGYLPILELPNSYTPEKGFWVTANNYQFPNNYPHPEAQHHLAVDPFRADRIDEFLSARMLSVSDMMQLQNDETSIPARSIIPLLRDLPFSDAGVERARDTLLNWNDVLDKNSPAAGIYEMFQRRLLANASDMLIPKDSQDAMELFGLKKLIDLLNAPGGEFGADPIGGRDKLLETSLEQAVAALTQKLGPDQNQWLYGQPKYHYALIRHPLSQAVNAETRKLLDIGPMPRGGDTFTVNATGGGDNQTGGGSMKIIVDLEAWDHSVGMNNPGQSGDPRSPHYKDLFELWARGKYFPIFYSKPQIESVTEQKEILQPMVNSAKPY
ncbi:MAG TPA: penicillin acylase family protein [Candidatus Angelobacter sp.]|jgi:penicillin amidase